MSASARNPSLPVFEKGRGAVPFTETCLVLSVDQGHMAELGHLEAEGRVHEDLAGRVVDVVVASQHVGDTHEGIVDHDGEIVGGRVVAPVYDEVVKLLGLKGDPAAHHVVKGNGAREGCLEPDNVGLAGVFLYALPARPVVRRFPPSCHGGLSLLVEHLGGAIAPVGVPFVEEP